MWVPLTCPLLGTWPATQGCALDWETNWKPFGSQARGTPELCCQPGQEGTIFKMHILIYKPKQSLLDRCQALFLEQIFKAVGTDTQVLQSESRLSGKLTPILLFNYNEESITEKSKLASRQPSKEILITYTCPEYPEKRPQHP